MVKVLRLMCLALLLLLTSCSVFSKTPPTQAVQLAIEQQLSQTQRSLAKDLGLPTGQTASATFTPNFKVKNISIIRREKSKSPRPIGNQNLSEVYRVSGTFDAELATPVGRTSQSGSPFDIYLATDPAETSDVKTWFVIQP